MFIIAFKTTRGAFKSYFVRVFTSFFVRHFDLVAPVMLINSGNITIHLKEHRVSTPSRNAESGIRKRNHENGNGNGLGNGIRNL